MRKLFILVCGIWFGTTKPLFNTFFKPFCFKLRKLYYEGISWQNPQTKQKYFIRVVAPLFIGDAPARAYALNIQTHTSTAPFNTFV